MNNKMISNSGVCTTAKQTARGERRRESHAEERNNNEESEEPLFNNAQGITERSSRETSQLARNCQRAALDRNN